MKIKISADSTCDYNRAIMEKYDISYTPLYVNMNGKDYKDGVDLSLEQLFEGVKQSGQLPKTAAVSVADYEAAFQRYLDEGYDGVIHINISSEFSACYQNAMTAAKKFENVYPIDSRNLSTGSGHLGLIAYDLAKEGMALEEIAKRLDEVAKKVEASFVIDTLEYLHKGGRCSSVAKISATVLSLKPCIEVKDGKMGVGKKYRGKLDACIEKYVRDRLTDREDIDTKRIFVTHTNCPANIVAHVKELIAQIKPFDEVLETVAGCTIGSHCGPATLGILFIRK